MSAVRIRDLEVADIAAAVDVVVDAGMFTVEDAGIVDALLRDADPEDVCVIAADGEAVVGVAVARPRPATDGLWELTMIGVRPSAQRAGVGAQLMAVVEERARVGSGRAMVVETSDTADFASARSFYLRLGYEVVAEVSDWWADGDGLVLHRRRLRG